MNKKLRKAAAIETAKVRQAKVTRRRFALGALGAAVVTASGFGLSAVLSAPPAPNATVAFDALAPFKDDIVYGTDEAPVTVVEYASLTCIHCARFHNQELPAFLEKWVETGKAKLVFRHFPYDRPGLIGATAVSCLPDADKKTAIAVMLRHPDRWLNASDPAQAATSLLGLRPAVRSQALTCAVDASRQEEVMQAAAIARNGGVSGTPSFVIGNRLYTGFMSADALGALVDAEID